MKSPEKDQFPQSKKTQTKNKKQTGAGRGHTDLSKLLPPNTSLGTCCLTSDKSLGICGPQLAHLQCEDNKLSYQVVVRTT